ncbi:MAG: flagellar basal body P-ring formation chaperone FlgA [Boseongicola sp.]
MTRFFLIWILSLVFGPALAETLTTVRAVRPLTIIAAEDLAFLDQEALGAISSPGDVIGMEARVTLYPGRPIRPGDIGPPALVQRNQSVELLYARGGLVITTEGRALGRGAAGDRIRAMNISSRTTISGRVTARGAVVVSSGFTGFEGSR